MNEDKSPKPRFVMTPHERLADPRYLALSNAAFGLLARLELVADALWPVAAGLPRYADGPTLAELKQAGMVELLPHDVFRVIDLDAVRQSQRDFGQKNARLRWDRDGGP